ncbi:late histone H2B.L4-like [Ursus americanus]|uniref:Late histone H2B.L4-like n=1 Tax=Ursus maritimus TaxID=29073 RepID=A0A8M1FVF7_URSMA|nr:late histone H2B.L4-like [Ursus maritimus]XP_045627961.1 late histone H2B.L4-like [Ursus americanus]XP_048069760.1 late histone H2B.L4-like [Ursus arctos]
MEVARDVRKCSDYKWASAPQQPAVSFLPNCREGEPHMAEPGCEPSSEESLGTEEPTAADPESPQQKQPRVLKQVHKGLSLSQKAVGVVGSFVKDVFERIADEAAPAKRSSKHSTISSREMQTALRPLLPGEIGKHAVSEATKAIIRDTFRQ